jgi:sugar (pentulose or hexulose) kinase
MSDCYIGVDVGTSGCRAVAIDEERRRVAEFSVELSPPRSGPDGASTQDPQLWWDSLIPCLSGLSEQLGGLTPRALALDATATSLLLAASDGTPLSPAVMYDDSRATEQAERIAAVAPPDSPARGASSGLAKLLYLIDELAPPVGTLALHQADWLLGRLCGRPGFSDWNNCLRMGYDPDAEAWSAWLENLNLQSVVLPRVQAPGTPAGRMTPDLARQTGLPDDLAICCGTTDSTASVLAAGVAEPGDGVSVLGSTLVIKLLSNKPIAAPRFGVYSHRIGDLWLVGGASNSGGAVLRRFFDDETIARLSLGLDSAPPCGLDYYPLLRPGERFPHSDPGYPPRLTPRPADDRRFLQGMLEGIAAIESDAYRLLMELGAPPLKRVISIGGGARNPQWSRIREHILGVPVVMAQDQQAAHGAALLALSGFRQRVSF